MPEKQLAIVSSSIIIIVMLRFANRLKMLFIKPPFD